MKSRVKHGNLRHFRCTLHGHFNTHKVGRVVQGSQRDQSANGVDYLFIDPCGFFEFFAAVYHPMADA